VLASANETSLVPSTVRIHLSPDKRLSRQLARKDGAPPRLRLIDTDVPLLRLQAGELLASPRRSTITCGIEAQFRLGKLLKSVFLLLAEISRPRVTDAGIESTLLIPYLCPHLLKWCRGPKTLQALLTGE